MSKTIYKSKKMYLHQFYGGEKKGISIQIGSNEESDRYIQLNIPEVKQLIRNLNKWLKRKGVDELNPKKV